MSDESVLVGLSDLVPMLREAQTLLEGKRGILLERGVTPAQFDDGMRRIRLAMDTERAAQKRLTSALAAMHGARQSVLEEITQIHAAFKAEVDRDKQPQQVEG